jgi:hypothetical protein
MNAQDLIDIARILITAYKLRAPIVSFYGML